jgi:nucleotide-binding universal stress UspA family protein
MRKIVVGVDGSPCSEHALKWACEEAARTDGEVTAVHSWTYPYPGRRTGVSEPREDMELEAMTVLRDSVEPIAASMTDRVVIHSRLVEGPAVQSLLDEAADADMLVVGSRGRGGFAAMMLGSVSNAVVHHASCPVVVIRQQ